MKLFEDMMVSIEINDRKFLVAPDCHTSQRTAELKARLKAITTAPATRL